MQSLEGLGYELLINMLGHKLDLAYNYPCLTVNVSSKVAPWNSFGSLALPGMMSRIHLWDTVGQEAFLASHMGEATQFRRDKRSYLYGVSWVAPVGLSLIMQSFPHVPRRALSHNHAAEAGEVGR